MQKRRGRTSKRRPSRRRTGLQWLVPASVVIGLGLVVVAGISSRRQPPPPPHDVCRVFAERPDWHDAARRTAREWKVSEAVQMAFIQQESGLRGWVRPPRRPWWWILPGRRPSTAFGFAQALDGTWDEYRRARDRAGARRDLFADASDFVGWQLHRLHLELGLDKSDVFDLYLAYHEGARGYRERRFADKPEVRRAATRVATLARTYSQQYESCAGALWRRRMLGLAARLLAAVGVLALLAYGLYRQHQALRRRTERR